MEYLAIDESCNFFSDPSGNYIFYENHSIYGQTYRINLTILYHHMYSWLITQTELWKLIGGKISIYSICSRYITLRWSNNSISIYLKTERPNFIPFVLNTGQSVIVSLSNQSYYMSFDYNLNRPECKRIKMDRSC